MMTEAIKPLGMYFYKLLFQLYHEETCEIGGRLFLDISHDLASRIAGRIYIHSLGEIDILMQNALLGLLKHKDFIKKLPHGKTTLGAGTGVPAWVFQAIKNYWHNDPLIVDNLITQNEALITNLERKIANISGDDLFELIQNDMKLLKEAISDGYGAILVATYAGNWIDKKMQRWLGEKNAADLFSKSMPNNITAEMGLELLDVADIVRRYPAAVEYLHRACDETFFEDLSKMEGGAAVSQAIREYLRKYGMRCPGEIDITRTRWNEHPCALVPVILSNVKSSGPIARNRFEQGLGEVKEKQLDFLGRLERLPLGKWKARRAGKMISVLRNFGGYREYPKYFMICHYWIYKKALLWETAKLVQKNVLRKQEDIYFLAFEELREAVNNGELDYGAINKRMEEYEGFEKLTPPRVMISDGEIISGDYHAGNIPKGALMGVPVSSGIIDGRARVVMQLEDANIEDGDILVTTYTDPSWTPLFVSVKGLVTEVGGLLPHGTVIAREYGLPAVVGVENATKLIKDGQKIRVNGTAGYVELI